MPNITPFWDDGDAITCLAVEAIIGGRGVAISGPMVNGNPQVGIAGGSAAGITGSVVGVAEFDVASGGLVTVATEGVWPITAGANFSAGSKIKFDSTGRAIATTAVGVAHGVALDDATTGNDVPIRLRVNTAIAV